LHHRVNVVDRHLHAIAADDVVIRGAGVNAVVVVLGDRLPDAGDFVVGIHGHPAALEVREALAKHDDASLPVDEPAETDAHNPARQQHQAETGKVGDRTSASHGRSVASGNEANHHETANHHRHDAAAD